MAVAPGHSRRNSFLELHGEVTDINKKGENQDSQLAVAPLNNDESQAMFLVFDGHGAAGKFASVFAIHRVAFHVETKLAAFGGAKLNDEQVSALLVASFLEADDELAASSIPVQLSGTTATVCLILNDTDLYVANCGDSRAVIARSGEPACLQAAMNRAPEETRKMFTPNGAPMLNEQGRILLQDAEGTLKTLVSEGCDVIGYALCRDHNATLPDEAARVARAGGVCFKWQGEGPMRIFVKNQFKPGICPSRTMGDRLATTIGVVAEPEVHKFKIEGSDKALIVATDGLWDVLDNDQAARIALAHDDAHLACKLLLEVAEKGKNDDGDINEDNVTVQVIFLNDPLGQPESKNGGAVASAGRATNVDTKFHTKALKVEASLLKDADKADGIGDAAKMMATAPAHQMSCEDLETWFMDEMRKDPGLAESLGVVLPRSSSCDLL